MPIYDFSYTNHSFGNQNLASMLDKVINSNRLSHAYLFYGSNQLFKTHIALNFAMKIFCSGNKNSNEVGLFGEGDVTALGNSNLPCGVCSACKKFLAGSHPDLYLYDREGELRTGRDSIHIETTRFIRQDAYIRPNESEYKIYVIPNIQDMSIGAVNAFLKVLEEPPRHAIFLLTAISKTAILDTILSRCIHFEVFPITMSEVTNALKILRPEVDLNQVEVVATASDGFLGKAIGLLEDETATKINKNARDATIALLNGNEYQLLLSITRANTSRVNMLTFLSEFSINIKSGLKYKIKPYDSSDKLIIAMADKFSLQLFYNILEVLEQVRKSINFNVNMDVFCLNLSSMLMRAKSEE